MLTRYCTNHYTILYCLFHVNFTVIIDRVIGLQHSLNVLKSCIVYYKMEIESKIYNFSKTKIYIFPGKMHFTSINRLLKLFNYNFSVWII